MSFVAQSRTLTGTFPVTAPVARVFPLFSPQGEREWAPGWDPELLFPPGVEWEEEMIFRTVEETGDAVWIVTRLDRSQHRVVYHRVEPGRWVARVEVGCRPLPEGRTSVTTSYRYLGLSESGNREIAAMSQTAYDEKMERWAEWVGAAARR